MGAPKSWEEYLWKDLHIVPVPDLNKGRINLLDIFVQDGRSYHMRHLLRSDPDKPFRRRELVHVGSMITFADEDVPGWLDKKTDLDDDLKGLSDDEDDDTPVNEPFSKGPEGKDRKTVVRADSKFLARLFGFAEANFDTSRKIEVKISSPSYRRVMENHFLEFIGAKQGKKAQWKPDIGSISSVERKGVSIFDSDEILELWIVTELKFGTINYTVEGGGGVGAEVSLQGLEVATPVPVAGGLKATTSKSVGVESDEAAANENALYGFKAIRLKFDKQGNYISRRGNMGQTKAHVTRAGEEDDLKVDSDFEYHMKDFFVYDEDGSDDTGYCVPLVFHSEVSHED